MDAHLTEPPVKAPRTNDAFADFTSALGAMSPTAGNARMMVGYAHTSLEGVVRFRRPKLRAPFAAVTRYLEEGVWEKPAEVVGTGPFPLAVSELVEAVGYLVNGELPKAMELATQAAQRSQGNQWEQAPLE